MSTVFRVEKSSNYTVMSNFHIQDHSISWKAKGLLSTILSLPPNWDYTLSGLATIAKDGVDSTRAGINELENSGYINRKQTRDEFGRMSKNEYVVYERPEDNPDYAAKSDNKTENPIQLKDKTKSDKPKKGYISGNSPSWGNPTTVSADTDFPLLENPITEKPITENPTQLNTKKINTKILNTKRSNNNQSYQSITETKENEKKIDADEIRLKREMILSNIEYDSVISQNSEDKDLIDEIVDIMLEMYCCNADSIRIGGNDVPTALVHSRIMKITSEHIVYMLISIKTNTKKARNIKAYMRTVIYNAPSTMNSFMQNDVNAMLYGNEETR